MEHLTFFLDPFLFYLYPLFFFFLSTLKRRGVGRLMFVALAFFSLSLFLIGDRKTECSVGL